MKNASNSSQNSDGTTTSILAVGSEITNGQIINKNASWLSSRLDAFGLRTAWHLAVPDNRQLILEAINLATNHSDWVFITGGLGPTSDDFTRDLVCEWAGVETFFHEPSWTAINERLSTRGIPVQEFQKQQCYFPVGAEVLANSQGTANGFKLAAKGKTFFVLPGPPREIEAIWKDHLSSWVATETAGLDPWLTKSWDLLGVGEGQVAAAVAPIVDPKLQEIGYRVHMPYVEFKISYRKSQATSYEKLFADVEKALAPWIALRDGEDIAQTFCDLIPTGTHWSLHDVVTDGYLIHRLEPALKPLMKTTQFIYSNFSGPVAAPMIFALEKKDDNTAVALCQINGEAYSETFSAPYKSANMSERRQQYFAEKALIFWARNLGAQD